MIEVKRVYLETETLGSLFMDGVNKCIFTIMFYSHFIISFSGFDLFGKMSNMFSLTINSNLSSPF